MEQVQAPQGEEPEGEIIPDTPMQQPMQPAETQLQQAMRRSLDQLDGHPAPPPGLGARQRSRSPLREARNVRIPEDNAMMSKAEAKHFHCFVAKRFQTKNRKKAGAGRELNYDKETAEVQEKLDGTRLKEWGNWKQFSAVDVIPPDNVEQFKEENPDAEILPSRWVDTNKAEEGEPDIFKSRLVVRGDLEENQGVRTDSPTATQLFLNLIICWAASTGSKLRSGDISAAFLQGACITRLLAIMPPKGGIPDPEVKPGSLPVARKSVYGTRDAPRGFWKALHDVLVGKGLLPVPLETAAYYLPGEKGKICGMLACHVDDLLWAGNDKMQEIMLSVQQDFKFGVVENDEMKYCGRIISQSEDGIKVTCPNILDRTKAIYIDPARRKQLAEPARASEISQLRSVVGSLSWLGRICRPDLCFRINQLQAVQQHAQVRHLIEANKLLSHAMQDREKGIYYPKNAMVLENAIITSVTDASFGQSVTADVNGNPAEHRSQTGRILLLTNEEFESTGTGVAYPIEWHSNTIKRVCRPTLQAETMSLQLGSEEAEHLRHVLFTVKNLSTGMAKQDQTLAMDATKCLWLTDCRSLADHLQSSSGGEVTDKRLAIDLTSLRQDVWRAAGETAGNPAYSEKLPNTGTTVVKWIATKSMVADALTKPMKTEQLDELTSRGTLQVLYTQ